MWAMFYLRHINCTPPTNRLVTMICRYNDALWKAFGEKLEDSLNYEMNWAKPGGHKSVIGCLDLCSSGATQSFIEAVSHASTKGIASK